MNMNEQITFLKTKFSEYYQNNIKQIFFPASIEKREYGFFLFKDNMMIRHKSFQSEETFINFLCSVIPSDVYYSSAYYEKPEESMGKKEWLGADLVFDIDSDHIETACKKTHEYWICKSCETIIQDITVCPRCGNSNFKKETWVCESCLEAAKTETLKLIDFLVNDFGFPFEQISVCFSGQRGYHVSVEMSEIKHFDQNMRKEIVDYITATGLIIKLHGLTEVIEGKKHRVSGPDLTDPGWNGRIAKGVYGFLSSLTPQSIAELSCINNAMAKNISLNRDLILNNWSQTVPWGTVKGIGLKTWEHIIQRTVKEQAVAIDTVVTTDLHRLIRLPQSLHGKTGLKASEVPIDSLAKFDPLVQAVVFRSGTLKVYVNKAYRFKIGNREFGPYTQEEVVLPMAAAIFLLCKRVATLKI